MCRSRALRYSRNVNRCGRASVFLLLAALAGRVVAAGIVPDGASATTVSTGASGQAMVQIAPAASGVSHNTYTAFSVGRAGAELVNTGVNARAIVNEVTSTRPSLIEGPVSVVGARANVILANPNGITVNGGSFVNTGSVALSTGKVSFIDFALAPGLSQRNVVLTTSQGAIEIGPEGLSGAFNGLELIAKELKINGPVANTYSSQQARIRAIAGDSRAEVDTSVSPLDGVTPWIAYSSPETINTGATLIDITPLGSLTAGRIEIAVTDQGAGVKNAGTLHANAGDFVLSANGELRVAGGTIKAAGDVIAQTASVAMEIGVIESGRHIEIVADDVVFDGGRVEGGAIQKARVSANGGSIALEVTHSVRVRAADLAAAQDIAGHAADFTLENLDSTGPTVIAAAGGVLLEADQAIANRGGLIQGATRIAGNPDSLGAVTLKARAISNESLGGGPLAVIFGAGEDVVISAAADFVNRGARVISNRHLKVSAGRNALNLVDHLVGDGERHDYKDKGRNWLGITTRKSGFSINYGALANEHAQALLVANGTLEVNAENIENRGGELIANDGDIRLVAYDKIVNEALATGSVRFERSCGLLSCKTKARSDVQLVGGLVSANRDLEMRAGSVIENVGGRMLALHDISLSAPRIAARALPVYTSLTRAEGLKAWFGDSWARIYGADQGGLFTARMGRLRIDGTAYLEGGTLAAAEGVEATGEVITVRSPQREPVRLQGHIGLSSWMWD
jgi:filamentous hemagglutinin family protein